MALTSTPPIYLLDVLEEFEASDLAEAGEKAGLTPPIYLLDFLGLSAKVDHSLNVGEYVPGGTSYNQLGYISGSVGTLASTNSVFYHSDSANPTVPNTITKLVFEPQKVILELTNPSSHSVGDWVAVVVTAPFEHEVFMQYKGGGVFTAQQIDNGNMEQLFWLLNDRIGQTVTLHFEDRAPNAVRAGSFVMTPAFTENSFARSYGATPTLGSITGSPYVVTSLLVQYLKGSFSTIIQTSSPEYAAIEYDRTIYLVVNGTRFAFKASTTGLAKTADANKSVLYDIIVNATNAGQQVSFQVEAEVLNTR